MKRFFIAAATTLMFTLCAGEALAVEGNGVAVLAAMESELSVLKKEVELVGSPMEFEGRTVYQARFEGMRVVLARTGATPEAAKAIAQWLVQERGVSAVVSIGTAGAISGTLQVGDVVTAANAVRDGDEHEGTACKLRQIKGCDVKPVNTIVTVSGFVASSGGRGRLQDKYGADVVDMSAAEIARACAAREVPCVIIREVSDRADESAPRAFSETARRQEPRTVGPALCTVKELVRIARSRGREKETNP